uniref:Uncharacterized protein n=1 Tax=Anguilla anguilla TaxID=7936 RepID=A0A0E9XSC7_ANGAN
MQYPFSFLVLVRFLRITGIGDHLSEKINLYQSFEEVMHNTMPSVCRRH